MGAGGQQQLPEQLSCGSSAWHCSAGLHWKQVAGQAAANWRLARPRTADEFDAEPGAEAGAEAELEEAVASAQSRKCRPSLPSMAAD